MSLGNVSSRMSLAAAGAYLKALRENRGLSQAEIAAAVGSSERTVIRWEKGDSQPDASELMQFVNMVKGSIEQLYRLFLDDSTTVEDGRRMATSWLSQESITEIDRRIEEMSTEERETALKVLSKMLEKR